MILLLGGTGEARAVAAALAAAQVPFVSSLAGRVANPRLPVGAVRIGGFGGADGLARWLADAEVTAVLDATHPFARRISANAVTACAARSIPLLRLERPGWAERPGWRLVDDLAAAAAAIPAGARVFLTTGRGGLDAFSAVEHAWFLIRCVDPPAGPLPAHHRLLLARGPYTPEGEGALIDTHRLDLLITKDSGGALTEAKLEVAAERELAVIVVRRPSRPDVATVTTVADAVAWALSHRRPAPGTGAG